MLASLIATGLWIQIASYFGWPVSTTHTIVGAVIGFGLVWGGLDAIYWVKLGRLPSLIISPCSVAVLPTSSSQCQAKNSLSDKPIAAAKRLTPY